MDRNFLFTERLAQQTSHDSRVELIFIPKCHVVSIFRGTIHKMKAAHGDKDPQLGGGGGGG